ncbi:sialate O-acetylesterase [Flavihumibacter solisilvae]|uniref:Sialate O-acetylesterase n=1 Tax=Flavihumibacter solisilvae TaxID=1349421 RepID=A0A0C1L6U9_9BACT|nr:sialate O-acetylesterase [Flavihumibacter solisilvae]KIC95862.1 sialate O-acetylesterase [Flavihumibacter solisilvae]
MKPVKALLAVIFTLAYAITNAQLRLPAIISSGMVLQQKDSVSLWGWAGPGEKVYVTTGWDNRTDSTITTNLAAWNLKVMTPSAGGPYNIRIRSHNTIQLDDVMIGEVWICSGQSNMEWSYLSGTSDIASEFPQANNRNLRFFHVPKTGADRPQDDLKASWAVCDSVNIRSFSSVGYFFGRRLQQDLNVPIGLINASWGGTPAETWTPEDLVLHDPVLRSASAEQKPFPWWPSLPGQAFNGMIAPLTKYRIAGAIWYQGESNTGTWSSYRHLFTTMIDSWRKAFHKDLPFYYVQIAPYKYGQTNIGALLQESQTRSMAHPNTGMVVITDLVDNVNDIHPSRKRPVGERLAGWALGATYGKAGLAYRSPELASAVQEKGRIILRFKNAPGGFKVNGGEVTGFYISGESEAWFPAKAKVEKDKIIVWSPDVKTARFVRYGFGNTIIGNVSSVEGLPIVPFRTDDWQPEIKEVK